MIVRGRPSTLVLLFAWRGSMLPRIIWHLAAVFAFATLVELVARAGYIDFSRYSVAPFTLLGIALSIFLGFRNNASYDRWWEGRKQFGQMVADVRCLARSSSTLLGPDSDERRRMLTWVAAHYHALRGQLRREPLPEEACQKIRQLGLDPQTLAVHNGSDFCLRQAGEVLGELYRSGRLDSMATKTLDEHLSRLANVQAACERLVSTPLPFAYNLLTHRTVYLYCYLLPFGLAGSMGWFTPVFTLIVAYTFFGLDALAQELEEPFGHAPNHLPLNALCRVNDISIAEALGQPAPEPLQPVDHILR